MTVLERERALAETLGDYAGRWIAVNGQHVVANAETVEELLEQIKEDEIEIERFFHVPEATAAACYY